MPQIMKIEEAIKKYVKDGSSIMIGGFLGCNTPYKAIDQMVKQGSKELTIISTVNSFTHQDMGKLFDAGLVRKFIGSHIGTNAVVVNQYRTGKLQVEYYPQGTLIEKIRCAGAGLGGVLTPTGIGTLLEEGKEKIEVNGKEYLLETPLSADVAIIKGFKADKKGNIVYKGTANANPIMATAGKITIAEVDEIVEVGELEASEIGTPGIFVNAICLGYEKDEFIQKSRDMYKAVGIFK
ncbi:CoA transferase subunit A [Clostridium sp. MB40-C1]|uniref:CoA transferase subunit A n=1 Tax=Clostridium sp. MB40-C1 TaxID=3070996 RepID=UPI0027E184CC|nr:CoA transferase subunit A [Clostridium sp. MB40-C1]WMJ79963.1 CoA transferase subunit A [Clostridium sp. MB40-C1]